MLKSKRKLAKKFYRINQNIQSREVRVIDDEGKQIGVMLLEKALQQAQEKELDLIEVAPNAKPPVCKIVDFKKFKFLEAKKEQQEKKKAKKVNLKEVKLSPFIADNDFNFRLKRAEEFLKEGHKVKIAVFFKGRQITKKDFGYKLIEKALERLASQAEVDLGTKFVGRKLEVVLKPVKGGKSGQETKDENQKVSR